MIIKAFSRIYTHPQNKGRFFSTTIRLIWWMVNRHFLKLSVIVEMLPGVKLICDPKSSYGSLVFYNGLPEYAEQMFMYQFVEGGDTIIDIGAHIGSETVLLGSKLGKGHIYSFEPTPGIVQRLKTNISINNLEAKVDVEEMAVSDHDGKTKFYLSKESEINSLHTNKDSKAINIKTISLDKYANLHHLKHVNMLKIDVEGHEYSVIIGSKTLLTKHKIDVIVFEVNDQSGQYYQDNLKTRELLRSFGYKLYLIGQNGQLVKYVHCPLVHNCVAISPKIKPSRMKNIKYD